jgi:hypothetical protein
MFLHTYTFATNRISLVLEELKLCRNLHQIQVEYIEKALIGKAQMTKEGKKPNPMIKPRPTHINTEAQSRE